MQTAYRGHRQDIEKGHRPHVWMEIDGYVVNGQKVEFPLLERKPFNPTLD